MYPIHTILHPTDFSPGSAFAFQMACALAKDYNARLILLYVVRPPTTPLFNEPLEHRFPWPKPPDPKVSVEHRVAEGDAPEEILRLVEKLHCDLIVMGTQGRTGLSRWLAGSMAEEVLRKAPCPVLAVKSPPFTPVPHAQPGDVADVRPLGANLASTKTRAWVNAKEIEVIRMMVPAGKEIPMRQGKGNMVLQCLEGRVEFMAVGKKQTLEAGQLFYLPRYESYSVKGLVDASLLVTQGTAMNLMDPKISHALDEIETVYSGKEESHSYFDHKNKVYVLVVSGEEADMYHTAVRAIHDLARDARRKSGTKHS